MSEHRACRGGLTWGLGSVPTSRLSPAPAQTSASIPHFGFSLCSCISLRVLRAKKQALCLLFVRLPWSTSFCSTPPASTARGRKGLVEVRSG